LAKLFFQAKLASLIWPDSIQLLARPAKLAGYLADAKAGHPGRAGDS